ncbi:MAG: DNA repair protein RecO [Vallitalea sp.]|jgi:DNA repair protein RecO (recombination protein O)|nr:DNA repair protein RecO [Vallitalea sp.]
MAELKTKGIIVREMPVSEYDKRVVIITKDKGKITAFARGARKPNSAFLAGTQIFSYGEYVLYKGKSSSYNIKQVQLIEPFHNIRNDIDVLAYGLYVLEFSEYVIQENIPNNRLMKLMLKTLQVLVADIINHELIVEIFEIKAMSYIGYTPYMKDCINCGNSNNLHYFDARMGGVVCDNCFNNKCVVNISSSTIYTLKYILASPIEKLYSFQVEDNIKQELKNITAKFIDYHLNYKFRSLDFLIHL